MKKFKFRYQAVLTLREQREKREEQKLAELTAVVGRIDNEIARLRAEESDNRGRWHRAQGEGQLDLDGLAMTDAYLAGLARRIEDQQRARAKAMERVTSQRELLLVARQEREVMTRLEERDRDQWLAALSRAENALLDELGTLRFNRRGK